MEPSFTMRNTAPWQRPAGDAAPRRESAPGKFRFRKNPCVSVAPSMAKTAVFKVFSGKTEGFGRCCVDEKQ